METKGKTLTVESLPAKEVKFHPVGEHTHTLVWLHGLTSWGDLQCEYFFPHKTKLPLTMKVVCPSAPMVQIKALPAWVGDLCVFSSHIKGKSEINSWDSTMKNVEGYRGQVQRLWKILDEEVAILGGDSSKVFIAGHSQGCQMAFKTGLSYSKTLGGVIGLMGYASTDDIPQAPANSATPVLSVLGQLDPVCV
jgi:predicted esterase